MTNIYTTFREQSRHGGDFLRAPDGSVLSSYDDLATRSAQYANYFHSVGLEPGDRVSVQVGKSAENLLLYLGCLRAGLIYLPLNTAYRDEELRYFINNARPAMSVCDPEDSSVYETLTDGLVVTLDQDGQFSDPRLAEMATDFDTCPRADDDVAVILYTSGTTGNPKGAMISHGNLRSNGLTLLDAWQWQPDDVMLHGLPVFHIHGLFVGAHLPILNGSPIIWLPSFDANAVITALPDASVFMGVPTHYTRLLADERFDQALCQAMRLFTSGSAPLLPQTFAEFTARTGHQIVERYGMTETGMNTSNPVNGVRKPGTVGPPLPGVSARIVDPQGVAVATGETGQLEISGTNVFRGYWEMPDKTAADFTADGYFRTGDLASRDADGYIAIVGRDKDMIISGGLNIYPRELEARLDDLPGIIESAVIGVPDPDFGEAVIAVVVTAPDIHLDGAAIIADLKARIANFKVPKAIIPVAELPRNTMGKVQKSLLRETYADLRQQQS